MGVVRRHGRCAPELRCSVGCCHADKGGGVTRDVCDREVGLGRAGLGWPDWSHLPVHEPCLPEPCVSTCSKGYDGREES
ncbi:hypothetical protein ACFPRL_32100 [Pseudoclavibacter helvolus]